VKQILNSLLPCHLPPRALYRTIAEIATIRPHLGGRAILVLPNVVRDGKAVM
jgi:hypothetical protein